MSLSLTSSKVDRLVWTSTVHVHSVQQLPGTATSTTTRARSETVWTSMAYQHFLGHLESIPALLFWENSHRYALQAILWNLSKCSLIFASISGQDSASSRGQRERRQSYHTGTYFFPLQALTTTTSSTTITTTTIITTIATTTRQQLQITSHFCSMGNTDNNCQ